MSEYYLHKPLKSYYILEQFIKMDTHVEVHVVGMLTKNCISHDAFYKL